MKKEISKANEPKKNSSELLKELKHDISTANKDLTKKSEEAPKVEKKAEAPKVEKKAEAPKVEKKPEAPKVEKKPKELIKKPEPAAPKEDSKKI